jgi:hypothetical protein
VWEVLDGDAPDRRAAKQANSATFAAAMNAFTDGAFDEAIQRFDAVLRANAGDGAARYLHGRARDLAAAPTPWEGFDRSAK